MKKAIVYNLVDKAIQLSHFSFHDKNLLFIESALIKNNYPLAFIKKHIRKRIRKIFDDNNSNSNCEGQDFKDAVKNNYIVLPYVKSLNSPLKNILKKYDIKLINSINYEFENINN